MTEDASMLVIKAGKELVNTGLVSRTWGNVSCRIDDDFFMITPSGRDYLSLVPEEIVKVNMSDLSYDGDIKPSSEKGIHAAVYRQFPEISFVIHTHQEHASVVSALGIDQIALSENPLVFSNEILCASYALPGTKKLRDNVVEALEKTQSKALILRNHGALCFGRDYDEAFKITHALEKVCKVYIQKLNPVISDHALIEPRYDLGEIRELVLKHKMGYIIVNQEPDVIKFSNQSKPLKPFLDDFAQIIGVKAKVVELSGTKVLKSLKHSSAVFVEGSGALCWGQDESEARAVNMILSKNCKASFAVDVLRRSRPIHMLECYLMRFVYLKKYSKLSSHA